MKTAQAALGVCLWLSVDFHFAAGDQLRVLLPEIGRTFGVASSSGGLLPAGRRQSASDDLVFARDVPRPRAELLTQGNGPISNLGTGQFSVGSGAPILDRDGQILGNLEVGNGQIGSRENLQVGNGQIIGGQIFQGSGNLLPSGGGTVGQNVLKRSGGYSRMPASFGLPLSNIGSGGIFPQRGTRTLSIVGPSSRRRLSGEFGHFSASGHRNFAYPPPSGFGKVKWYSDIDHELRWPWPPTNFPKRYTKPDYNKKSQPPTMNSYSVPHPSSRYNGAYDYSSPSSQTTHHGSNSMSGASRTFKRSGISRGF